MIKIKLTDHQIQEYKTLTKLMGENLCKLNAGTQELQMNIEKLHAIKNEFISLMSQKN